MSITATKPATTPIPVQLSETEFTAFILPHDAQGKPAIHDPTVYRIFATWVDAGSLWQAFLASVQHLAVEKHLDTSVLHGDGTNTVAKKGAMASGSRATNTSRARKSSRSRTTRATF